MVISVDEKARFEHFCAAHNIEEDDVIGDFIRLCIWMDEAPERFEAFHATMREYKRGFQVVHHCLVR